MDAPGTIRRLWATEHGKVRDHLLRLAPEDRLLRFGGYVSDAHIEAHCDGLDWDRAVIIGYLVDGKVRGLAELRPMAAAGVAEAALSVEKPHQNRGIGSALLRRLIVIARNRSIGSLYMLCLLENGKMLRMARKLGADLTFEQGEVAGRLALPWPNHLTLLLELLDGASTLLAILRPAGSVRAPGQGPRRRVGARSRRRPGDRKTQARRKTQLGARAPRPEFVANRRHAHGPRGKR